MLLAAQLNAAAADISDPETEIGLALNQLDNLANRIDTAGQMSARQGLGPQNIAAQRAYDNALKSFRHQEWLSVIRDLNSFLNLSQVTEPHEYLRAQYMLGRAYEEIRLGSRALRAYFRYIAAYLTTAKQDDEQLIEVLRRIVPMAAQDGDSIQELRELLSSITSLDLAPGVRPEVLFIAAKAAARSDNRQLASLWLDESIATATDPRLKAKSLYIKALLALAQRDLETAEDHLSEVIQVDDGKNGLDGYNNRDLARLALARIAVRKKRYDAALRYYSLIHDDSLAYKDALFESIYIHLGKRQDNEARAKALLFVGKFPDATESLQLRSLLAYLDLRAGDLQAAAASIKASENELNSISKWMRSNFSGVSIIDHERLLDFIAISQSQVKATPTIEAGQKLFARISETARRLADIDGELRDTIYALGRTNIERLKPRWVNRAEQISKLADEALTIGHRLAAAERHLYTERLSPVDVQRLNASETRRIHYLTPAAASKRKTRYWRALVNFFSLTEGMAKKHQTLLASRADLASARYLLDHSKRPDLKLEQDTRLKELEARVQRATVTIATTLTRLRREKLEHLIRQSPHQVVRKFLAQYATALHEENAILQELRAKPRSTSDKLLADDTTKAWKRWQFVIDKLFGEIESLDQDVRKGIGQIISDIEKHEKNLKQLSDTLALIRSELERRMGGAISSIVDNYGATIEARQSRHRKWTADIDWIRHSSAEKSSNSLTERYELESQILRDNLTDLQQGVLWKWPD